MNMKLSSYFEKLCSNITPSQTYVQMAAREHKELRRILENDVEVSRHDPDTFLQGSYAMGTAIKQIKDVDIVIALRTPSNASIDKLSPAGLYDFIYSRLAAYSRYADKLEKKRRSIGISMGVDIDIVPAVKPRNLFAKRGVDYPIYIPDRELKRWVKTHPKGHIAYSIKRNRLTSGNYVKLIKCLKCWRDNVMTSEHRPKSVIIEGILAGVDNKFISLSIPDGFLAFLARVCNRYPPLHQVLGTVPTIPDPVMKHNNLSRDWSFEDYRYFVDRSRESSEKADQAYHESMLGHSVELWRELFGSDFPLSIV